MMVSNNNLNSQMRVDKRRWTTLEHVAWLGAYFPAYMEAQSLGRFDKFWPGFFQSWFEKFPAPEPSADEPTDSEHESDSDSEQTDAEPAVLGSKRKHKNKKTKKRVSNIISPIFLNVMLMNLASSYWSSDPRAKDIEETRSRCSENSTCKFMWLEITSTPANLGLVV
jgi:hypothetical protein